MDGGVFGEQPCLAEHSAARESPSFIPKEHISVCLAATSFHPFSFHPPLALMMGLSDTLKPTVPGARRAPLQVSRESDAGKSRPLQQRRLERRETES